MAEPRNDDFLDDIDVAVDEEFAGDIEEIDDEALELDELRAERDQFRDRFMRALADAENARKRSDKDRREAENYGGSKLARDMLPIYDNMKRALETASEEQRELDDEEIQYTTHSWNIDEIATKSETIHNINTSSSVGNQQKYNESPF